MERFAASRPRPILSGAEIESVRGVRGGIVAGLARWAG